MYNPDKDGYGRVIAVVGLQYGSEGKGAIVSYLSPCASVGIRTGAPNAGHTIYYKGRKFVMRQIPCVWINPYAKLVIGRGALINLDILLKELRSVSQFSRIKDRLFIDHNAHVITNEHVRAEQNTDLAVRIGSTSATSGEGIGVAAADKILRKSSCVQARDVDQLKKYCADTVDMINSYVERDEIVILEGTQGYGISIDFGTFPYVTSRNVTATALATDAGLSMNRFNVQVIGVARVFPIRVAGNSGPFDKDSDEITWNDVTKIAQSDVPIVEKTSVTKKVRRVATFSREGFQEACQVNRPDEIAITFADYLDWSIHEKEKTTGPIEDFLDTVDKYSEGAEVTLVQTGPQTTVDFDWHRRTRLRQMRCW
ncbi:adenylosuccinate synthetase [Patescibacteria group bacterium AH-259-L05]|nr:adenylosuccinate synthetase [Patescibacteria group bacterium AH-259-L05]